MLLEHYDGTLPAWLSPLQARVIPIAEPHKAFAAEVAAALKKAGIRADVDESNESLGKKIREAKTWKVPYTLVIGDAEVTANTASLEGREGKQGALPIADIVSKIKEAVANRQ